MTASAECRAKRRYNELLSKGIDAKYEDVLSEMNERDNNDSNRKIAPAKPAPDALIYDTSDMTFEESVGGIVKIVKEKNEF
jgi:cytidylate kinase